METKDDKKEAEVPKYTVEEIDAKVNLLMVNADIKQTNKQRKKHKNCGKMKIYLCFSFSTLKKSQRMVIFKTLVKKCLFSTPRWRSCD